ADSHVWNGAQDGQVFVGQVSRAQRRVNGAAAAAEQTHRQVVQAEIHQYLLVTAPRQKSRDGIDVRNFPVERQAGRHADDVRFIDPLHEKAVGEFLRELLQILFGNVRADEDDAVVAAGQFVNRGQTRFPHDPSSNSA